MHRNSLILLLFTAIGVAACGSKPAPPPPPAGGGKTVDTATAATLTGRVTFVGAVPTPDRIVVNHDAACLQALGSNSASEAVLVSADGGLQNVFIHVKDAFAEYSFAVPATAFVLDQKGCKYTPRVFGIRAGQTMEIINSDDTMHNVHALPMTNQEFNKGLALRGQRMTQVFTAPEVMVRFKCDVHAWMSAWVGVMAHPFFSVSAADGTYSIKGLPPGSYTVEAWHEKFGVRSAKTTLAASQTQTLSFTFDATTPAPGK
jgi:plastocyanin